MSEKKPPIVAGAAITLLAFIGWLIFILLHTLFWSKDFTRFENIVIGFVSLLVVALLIGLIWLYVMRSEIGL